MHFRFFDDLMGSVAPEASPEFRFDKGREYSKKNYSSNYLKNVWKIYIKTCTKLFKNSKTIFFKHIEKILIIFNLFHNVEHLNK